MNILELQFNEDPNKSAEDYSRLVFSKIQSFDSAILGVGDDGHIASLFPYTNALNDESIKFVAAMCIFNYNQICIGKIYSYFYYSSWNKNRNFIF